MDDVTCRKRQMERHLRTAVDRELFRLGYSDCVGRAGAISGHVPLQPSSLKPALLLGYMLLFYEQATEVAVDRGDSDAIRQIKSFEAGLDKSLPL